MLPVTRGILLGGAVLLALPGGDVWGAAAPPGIILMMADDLGWGDVGFNGNTVIRTPHLDAMAAAGLKFTRFYAASAVCSPTRGSVVTGRHPFRYGIPTANAGHMKPEERTLAELLKEHNYVTGHFGKWHLGTLTKTLRESNRGGPKGTEHYAPPWDNGFDVCFSTEAKVPTYDPMLQPGGKAGRQYWDFIADRSTAAPYGTHYWSCSGEGASCGELVTDRLEGDDSRVIMDRALPFVTDAVRTGRPFFAIIWFHAPHLPVVAGPEHAALYADHDGYARNYFGCITALDEQVGRLRATLRELGVAEQTLVTFCADNGPEGQAGNAPGTAGPFRGRKRDLYEGGIRVPGLIEWPAEIAPGSVTDFPAVTSDYLPTLLDILGVDVPGDRPLDGVSLRPVFAATQMARPQPIGFEFGGQLALCDNRYKLLYRPGGGRKSGGRRAASAGPDLADFALYDLLEDPEESTDIAADHADVVARMAGLLSEWRASCARSAAGDDYRD